MRSSRSPESGPAGTLFQPNISCTAKESRCAVKGSTTTASPRQRDFMRTAGHSPGSASGSESTDTVRAELTARGVQMRDTHGRKR